MAKIGVFVKNLSSGGAEKQAVLLALSLANTHDTSFIIFNKEKVHQRYLDMLGGSKVKTIAFSGSKFSRFRQLVKYFKSENIEVVFSYLTAANLYASLAGIITGAKIITGLRNARLPLHKHLADAFITNFIADGSIANCFSGKEYFARHGFLSKRISVIPNCFQNISPYCPKKNQDVVTVVSVGRFVAQKDYETAIKAISILKNDNVNIKYRIIGYGKLEYEIRQLIKQYGIEPISEIYLNPNNIPQLLDESDIYLSTSTFEGTSNAIMEALNANLPIVATNVGDNYRLIVDGENGYLADIRDYKRIALLIKNLTEDSQLRTKMGLRGKNLLDERFSQREFTTNYQNFISNILNK